MKVLKRLFILFLVLVIVIFLAIYGLVFYLTRDTHEPYIEFIEKYSTEYSLEKELVTAVIKTESSFDADAKSGVGAQGLMQLMPDTVDWIAKRLNEEVPENILDPETNIRYGTYYLRYLINYYKNVDFAVMAYNAGFGNVDNWIGSGELTSNPDSYSNISFSETRDYIKKVKSQYHLNHKIYDTYYKDNQSPRALRALKVLWLLFSNIFK